MTIKEVKELIEKYKDKPIIVRTGYACFDYTESGEELIKVVTSMTEYKEPQFVPNPNGTITFYMPTEDGDGSIIPFKYKVIAWQYPCSPFPLEEFDKNRFEMNLEHFRRNIQHEEIYEGYRSYNLFGCQADDTLYIAKPTTQVDIKAINELYLYKNYGSICDTDLKPPLTKEDIGSLIVVLCELGDFRNCEFIRIERYDETIQEITEEINNYRNRFI